MKNEPLCARFFGRRGQQSAFERGHRLLKLALLFDQFRFDGSQVAVEPFLGLNRRSHALARTFDQPHDPIAHGNTQRPGKLLQPFLERGFDGGRRQLARAFLGRRWPKHVADRGQHLPHKLDGVGIRGLTHVAAQLRADRFAVAAELLCDQSGDLPVERGHVDAQPSRMDFGRLFQLRLRGWAGVRIVRRCHLGQ